MALTPTGVQFLSKGFSQFINNMSKASASISNLGRITQNRLAALQSYNEGMAKISESTRKMVASTSNAAVKIERLKAIREVNELFKQGALTANEYAQALNAINGKAIKLGTTMNKLPTDLQKFNAAASGISNVMSAAEGKFGGIFKGVADWGKWGRNIGGLIGTFVIPGLGSAMGAVIGQLAGMFYKLQLNIFKAIGELFGSITKAIVTFLPKTLAKIVNAGLQLGKALWNFGKQIINIVKTIISPITNLVKNMFGSLFSALGFGGTARGGWRSLGSTIFTAMFKFEILKQVIRRVIQEIKNFASESFNAAVELQTLTIRLDNLIAMQVRNADIVKDYANSIRIASQYTQSLLRWVEKLALSTPISVEEISKTVSLSIAMGWTVESAKKLTTAIVDYTTAAGLGNEIAERIIYNFAQMKQQGKVTGTELRDLGRGAFMPINKILQIMYENMGDTTKSFEQFREEASQGAIDVEGFFQAFEEFVAVNMPDAAKNMNYTFAAVRQNLQDLFKILLGWNVIGPLIKSMTKPLEEFINKFKSDEVLAKAQVIGKALAYIVDVTRLGFVRISSAMTHLAKSFGLPQISIENVVKSLIKLGLLIYKIEAIIGRFISSLVPFATKVGDQMGDTFDQMGNDFFSWGLKLIYQFAHGIVIGAAKFITAAINFVAKILSSWFSPGSPPKILPDIDKWGMETINEWLHGFKMADFTMLDDIKGVLKDALSSLADLGVISEEDVPKLYVEYSVRLIQALDEFNRTGKISANVFDDLAKFGGVYGREVAELLDLELKYVTAQKEYEKAVKRTLATETRAYGLIREYNKTLRAGADRKVLKSRLRIVNAAQVQLGIDRKAEKVAKEKVDIYEEQVKLQKELIKQLTDLTYAQKELAGGASGMAEDIATAMEDLAAGLGELAENPFEIDFEELKRQATEEFRKLFDETLPAIWDDAWYDSFVSPDSPFQLAVNNMATVFEGILGRMRTAWDAFAVAVHLPTIDKILEAWENPAVKAPEPETITMPSGQVLVKQTTTGAPTLIERFRSVIQTFADAVKSDGGIMSLLGNIASYIWDKIVEYMTAPRTIAVGGAGRPVRYVEIESRLSEIFSNIKDAASKAVSNIDWTSLIKDIGLFILRASYKIPEIWADITLSIIEGIWGGIPKAFEWLGTKTGELLHKFIAWLNDVFDIGSPAKAIEPVGADIIEGLYKGIVEAVSTQWETVKAGFQDFIDKVKTFFGIGGKIEDSPFYQIGKFIIDSIILGINTVKSTLLAIISEIANTISGLFDIIWDGGSPFKVFVDIGKNIPYSIAEGMKDADRYMGDLSEYYIPEYRKLKGPPGDPLKALQGLYWKVIKGEYEGPPAWRKSWMQPMQAAPVYAGNTVNFTGPVTIANGMDWAVFKAQVHRALVEG